MTKHFLDVAIALQIPNAAARNAGLDARNVELKNVFSLRALSRTASSVDGGSPGLKAMLARVSPQAASQLPALAMVVVVTVVLASWL